MAYDCWLGTRVCPASDRALGRESSMAIVAPDSQDANLRENENVVVAIVIDVDNRETHDGCAVEQSQHRAAVARERETATVLRSALTRSGTPSASPTPSPLQIAKHLS